MLDKRIPAFNFFTSSNLRRFSEKRLDYNWVQNKLKVNNTRIVVVSDLKLLLSGESTLHPVYIPAPDFPAEEINFHQFIYLGERDGINYFGVNISGHSELINSFLKIGQFKELRSIAALIDREDAAILAYTRALVYWQKNNKYCGVCGNMNESTDAGHKLICTNEECKTEHFPRTDPAVIMLVEKDGKCLLARQAKWPKNRYSTIAGYVEPGESLEQAVQREVFEETGIVVEDIKYHSSQPWPFPAAIMLGFRAAALSGEIKLGDHELEEAMWLSREEIIENMENGKLLFPPPYSVSFKLIQDWFDEKSLIKLEELVGSIK